jgi:hypothetical protein
VENKLGDEEMINDEKMIGPHNSLEGGRTREGKGESKLGLPWCFSLLTV